MYSVKQLQEIINREIECCLIDSKNKPVELYQPIEYVLSLGGKRLRPVLALMACNLFSENIDHALKPAIGLEIFHNFTLLHDDIMDKAELRRNMPTVHTKWNENTAILSGDAMSIIAYHFMAECDSKVLKDVIRLFNITALQVCEGQQLDMNFESAELVSVEEYLKMIELKTAVLIAASLKTGAIIGEANNEDAQALYEFGKNIGLAFQLQDDFLDVYGDTGSFGKKIGGDIVSNKKTFLLIKALELAKDEVYSELQQILNQKEFIREEKIDAVKAIFNKLNVKEHSQLKMKEYYDLGLKNLKSVKVVEPKKEGLMKLTENLMVRIN